VATPWRGPFCAGLMVDLRAPNAQFRDGTCPYRSALKGHPRTEGTQHGTETVYCPFPPGRFAWNHSAHGAQGFAHGGALAPGPTPGGGGLDRPPEVHLVRLPASRNIPPSREAIRSVGRVAPFRGASLDRLPGVRSP